ncbi:MAG: hypothetical protein WDW38_010288 [Sanguina aurantia]
MMKIKIKMKPRDPAAVPPVPSVVPPVDQQQAQPVPHSLKRQHPHAEESSLPVGVPRAGAPADAGPSADGSAEKRTAKKHKGSRSSGGKHAPQQDLSDVQSTPVLPPSNGTAAPSMSHALATPSFPIKHDPGAPLAQAHSPVSMAPPSALHNGVAAAAAPPPHSLHPSTPQNTNAAAPKHPRPPKPVKLEGQSSAAPPLSNTLVPSSSAAAPPGPSAAPASSSAAAATPSSGPKTGIKLKLKVPFPQPLPSSAPAASAPSPPQPKTEKSLLGLHHPLQSPQQQRQQAPHISASHPITSPKNGAAAKHAAPGHVKKEQGPSTGKSNKRPKLGAGSAPGTAPPGAARVKTEKPSPPL